MLIIRWRKAFAHRICCGPEGKKERAKSKNGSLTQLSMSLKYISFLFLSCFKSRNQRWLYDVGFDVFQDLSLVKAAASHWLSSELQADVNEVQSPNYSSIFASFAMYTPPVCDLFTTIIQCKACCCVHTWFGSGNVASSCSLVFYSVFYAMNNFCRGQSTVQSGLLCSVKYHQTS